MTFDRVGLFRSKGILFVSAELTDSLRSLHGAVAAKALSCGLAPDSHAFRPHITLARSRNRTGLQTLERLSTPELPLIGPPIQWVGDEVTLYRSELTPGGARHTTVAKYPLR